ncbi:MAG: hypothetical protein AB4352_03570 [Hormoscilla sp.]
MTLPLTKIAPSIATLKVILASSRFSDRNFEQLMGKRELSPLLCRNKMELLEGMRSETIEVLLLDVTLLDKQTQQFCWRTQNLYPGLKIILVGRDERELASHNWVYEFPDISTVCLSSKSESSVSTSFAAMPPVPNPINSASASHQYSGNSYMDMILGAAIFDLNGLPREYLITNEVKNMSWVQTIFQALGLRSLLMSSLRLEGFHHVTIYSKDHCALVVKQKTQYTALLINQTQSTPVSKAFIEWAQNFQPEQLKLNPLFHVT